MNEAIKYSDIIYFHFNCSENVINLCNKIKEHNKVPGLVIQPIEISNKLNDLLDFFKEVLVLSVEIPGISGQKFNFKSIELIDTINKSKYRKKISICVDGGITSNLIPKFSCEKIVSGSDVLNSPNPKRKIMKLQTLSRYEK